MSGPYASEMACRALGVAPIGTPLVGNATDCVMCSRPILTGSFRTPNEFGQSFSAYFSLQAGADICGWCSATTEQKIMRALQRCVITQDGVYPILKDVNRAWFLLTPPEPPFVVVVNTTGSALVTSHLHWRAPVSVDKNLILVQVDDRVIQLDRPLMFRAIGWCKQVADAMQARAVELKPKTKVKADLKHPFLALDRALEACSHGALAPAALDLAASSKDSSVLEALNRLRALGPGELWALATLVKRKEAVAERPEKVSLDDLLNKVSKVEVEAA